MENTYMSFEDGGAFNKNLIPNLTFLSKNNISFSSENNKGTIPMDNVGWTASSLIGQTSGVPFLIPISGNDLNLYKEVLPGATSIGDILNKEGYIQKFFIGSDANFGGRKQYFQQHGNYIIEDYIYAKDNNLIPNDYYEWWGYEDALLFEFAKESLKELSSKDKPFN